MLELVIPAGSPEAVRAAVSGGADAVYAGFGSFNSESCARNFSENEFAAAAEYCRVRGVKLYLTLDTVVHDGGFSAALEFARRGAELGASAIELSDLGLLRALRVMLPDTPLHLAMSAGTHGVGGAALAAHLGATRVILSPDLTADEIKAIAENAKLELELPCHGPLCAAAPGTCRLSAFTGHSSACEGDCGRQCRRSYTIGANGGRPVLSMKELCLVSRVGELAETGLTALRVLCRTRRPEYSALTAKLYSHAIRKGEEPDEASLELLQKCFSPDGMGEGLFGEFEHEYLFAPCTEPPRKNAALLASVRASYMGQESPRVPVRFLGYARRGEALKLAVSDELGNEITVEGDKPSLATSSRRELTQASFTAQLNNLGDSPFFCESAAVALDEGISVPDPDIIALRRLALDRLEMERSVYKKPRIEPPPAIVAPETRSAPVDISISVSSAAQLTPSLAALRPKVIYVPVLELAASPSSITAFWENGTEVCAMLPPVMHEGEDAEIFDKLESLRDIQVDQVLVSNYGHIAPAFARGFTVRGDIGLNVYNSQTLELLRECRVVSAAVSPEMTFQEIRRLVKCIPVEAMLYGRIPLMTSSACVIKGATGVCSCQRPELMYDRRASYPLARSYKCRTTLYSADKLFLPGKRRHYERLGLWCARLAFTTESPEECVLVTQRYLGQNQFEPTAKTKGLYL